MTLDRDTARDRGVSAPKRGQCATCHHRARLRKDGTMVAHHPYGGPDCPGTGKPPGMLAGDCGQVR